MEEYANYAAILAFWKYFPLRMLNPRSHSRAYKAFRYLLTPSPPTAKHAASTVFSASLRNRALQGGRGVIYISEQIHICYICRNPEACKSIKPEALLGFPDLNKKVLLTSKRISSSAGNISKPSYYRVNKCE